MIVDNEKDYTILQTDILNSDIIVLPVYSDVNLHPLNTNLSLLHIYCINSENTYTMLFNHCEMIYRCDILNVLLQHTKKIYTLDKKQLLYICNLDNIIDASLMVYLSTNKVEQKNNDTESHIFFNRTYYNHANINDIIPIGNHIQKLEADTKDILKIIADYSGILDSTTFKIYNDVVIHNYFSMEKNGMYVDKTAFNIHFPDKVRSHITENDFIFSYYNLYTRTGRPSNSFSGVNFAALNKEDGARGIIRSRFDKGMLVELDFDGYHIRLIADIIGYNFPPNMTVHEYLGRQYLGKDELTQEEYDLSKSISFQLMYGGISEEFEQIPFFKMLNDHIYKIWNNFEKVGYVESKLFKRRISKQFFKDINKYKLWNYIIQLHETENNNVLLYKLFEKIDKFKSKLILSTYDSFLFDMNFEDGNEFINVVKEVLEDGGKYPVKMSYGVDYNNMKKM